MAELQLHAGSPAELSPVTMYQILRLRVDVFVVEQQCPYPELDGRDLEPHTSWLWAAEGDRVLATLRVLGDADGYRIGRVATALDARSRGLAGRLMAHALELLGDRADIRLDAQSPLQGWYERFGFVRDGDEFVEDGIPHVPMRRPAG